jgi:hypothetical protein
MGRADWRPTSLSRLQQSFFQYFTAVLSWHTNCSFTQQHFAKWQFALSNSKQHRRLE